MTASVFLEDRIKSRLTVRRHLTVKVQMIKQLTEEFLKLKKKLKK